MAGSSPTERRKEKGDKLNYAFTVTPAEILGGILALCVAITTIAAAISVISTWFNKIKGPDKARDAEILALKNRMSETESKIQQMSARLEEGNRKFDNIEEGSHVMQRALLALLSHAIDGNNTDEMKDVRNELNRYLIERQI